MGELLRGLAVAGVIGVGVWQAADSHFNIGEWGQSDDGKENVGTPTPATNPNATGDFDTTDDASEPLCSASTEAVPVSPDTHDPQDPEYLKSVMGAEPGQEVDLIKFQADCHGDLGGTVDVHPLSGDDLENCVNVGPPAGVELGQWVVAVCAKP